MPIRVLENNLLKELENLNPGFKELTKRLINEMGLDTGIAYKTEKEAVKSPGVIFKKITVNESFLSYVWCIAFSLSVLYDEVFVKLSRRDYFGEQEPEPDKDLSLQAYNLWEYAVSLIEEYREWNEKLPNPEKYSEKYADLIPRINALYLNAMMFVLAHEFAHIELKHDEQENREQDDKSQEILLEIEADNRAIELVMEGVTEGTKTTKTFGILVGLCSLLFFNNVTKGISHPDTDDRIDSLLRKMNPEPKSGMWGIATLAYKLWDRLFEKKLSWEEGLESLQSIYENVRLQVQKLKP